MKNTIIATVISAMGILSAGAATSITATNAGGAATRQIQLTQGVPLTAALGGVYEIGVFAGDTFNASTTLENFTSAGSLAFGTQLGIFGTSTTGGNAITIDLPNAGASAGTFVNRPMYVVVRQPGTNPEGYFIAFSTPVTFAFENALDVGTGVSVTNAQLTLVRGTQLPGANTGLTGPVAAGNGGTALTFAPIPEPSAALLGALGALGLLRRRRI